MMTANPFFSELRRSWITQAALVIAVLYTLVALFGPWIAPYDPTRILSMPRQDPSAQFWLGTDEIGRDVLSRLLYGTRIAYVVAIVATGIGLVFGALLGLIAAFFSGYADSIIMRLMDILLAFPGLLLALAIITILGPGLGNAMIAIGVGSIPEFARLMRGEVLGLMNRDHVLAARSMGAGNLRIMGKHLVPFALATMLVYSTAQLARAVLTEAGLSYLGLGVQPPTPSWGGMIATGQQHLTTTPLLALIPGAAIMGLIFVLNILGDSLRDALDPHQRGLSRKPS
ncbi:probable ABC-transport protein, inner membrane component [Oceanicola granulosus HTCC2516]|uniref:Probable ABC-transport protein, inner membrane component n=1 Tax=Oceanicola granulosus (strain ATCC BAA-861 / DSM 15982 / KCTC 12143 / HTCC2516) TaxID=314256 RepID=Q2CEF4_OCEGH|nr:ABC transporter permease [Oceanicola granulosus]EAR51043.1 probable ABC-transport protein, inner membrane component [Oceanicola granulosus HTCC2516]